MMTQKVKAAFNKQNDIQMISFFILFIITFIRTIDEWFHLVKVKFVSHNNEFLFIAFY